MLYRRLGKSGLQVSALSLGSWITFANQIADDTAEDLMKTAYDSGINFFDNAEVYAKGNAEVLMGKILKKMEWGRDTFIVSSKVFWGGDRPTQVGLSRKHVVDACHQALKRLQVDYLDLYFCHRYDDNTPLEETVRAMHDLVCQGKILYWGTSEWTAGQILEAHEIAARYGFVPPAAEQPQYNLVFRKNVEIELPGVCTDTGIGLTTTSPLCSGVLTGKYNDHFPSDTRVSLKDLGWMKEALDGQEGRAVVEQVRRLTGVARALQISVAQLAVAWCLKNPHVSSVILGASTVPQLTENLASIECTDRLTPEIMAEIDRVMEYAEQPADAVPS